jgi:hypothetical protein
MAEHEGAPDHGAPHVALIIAIGHRKKRTPGGNVDGLAARGHLGKRARGGRAGCMATGGHVDKWIAGARAEMDRKGTHGALHRELGVPSGEKIPAAKLSAAKARAERTGDTKLLRRVVFAENVRK